MDETLIELKNTFELSDWQIESESAYDELNIKIKTAYSPEQFATIISGKYDDNLYYISKLLGESGYYYFHHFIKTDKEGRKWIYVIFNPKYPSIVNGYIKEYAIDNLYHARPICNHESIIKNGFQPEERNTEDIYYPERVFFKMGKYGWKGYKYMLSKVADRYMDINPSRKFNIYQIRADKLVDKYTFYRDPNCKESCYTEETIPYNGFNIYETITI